MTSDPRRPVDEDTWRSRFITIQMTRIGGTIVVLIGLGIWHSDWVRPGGWMAMGLPLAIVGLIISFFGPTYLTRRWRTPPGP